MSPTATATESRSSSDPVSVYYSLREGGVGESLKASLASEWSEAKATDGDAYAISEAADWIEVRYSSCVEAYGRDLCWSAVVNSARACRTQEPVYTGAGVPGGIRTRDMLLRRSLGLSAALT